MGAKNNNYGIAPTFSKTLGRHTLKFGADLRRLEMDYFQNNDPGGIFYFDNVFTGSSASSPGSTGTRNIPSTSSNGSVMSLPGPK